MNSSIMNFHYMDENKIISSNLDISLQNFSEIGCWKVKNVKESEELNNFVTNFYKTRKQTKKTHSSPVFYLIGELLTEVNSTYNGMHGHVSQLQINTQRIHIYISHN